jgi:V8-like Glu-specific endopeptidase
VPDDHVPVAAGESDEVEPPLTPEQLEDLATLLAQRLTRDNIAWVASRVLGTDVVAEARNEISSTPAFATRVVELLEAGNATRAAIAQLRTESDRTGVIALGLNHILRGGRLNDDAAQQAFMSEVDPLIGTAGFEEALTRVSRTVCAVGIGTQHGAAISGDLVGSGFLIGPDLVLTNYHVLGSVLDPGPPVKATVPGDLIFCYFDYRHPPKPNVPPAKADRCMGVRAVQENWLVYARTSLDGDGRKHFNALPDNEYDYAVIRLEKPIGRRPARLSGGAIRGWLSLPEKIDALTLGRLVVHQHPGKQAQHFDVGQFKRLDGSGTRLQYAVSTARGSSGGATVDLQGRLFALHNAEVQDGTAPERLNQGIRIDSIRGDLEKEGHWVAPDKELQELESDVPLWSLTDDVRQASPIIGRQKFRDAVAAMMQPAGERVLAVTGPPASGLRYSVKLLRRLVGPAVPVAEFTTRELGTLDPPGFLSVLVDQLGVLGLAGHPVPDKARSTEDIPRWLRTDLPTWLAERLTVDEELRRGTYPAWVVVDLVPPPTQTLFWANNLKDLLAALVGVRDVGQTAVDLPHLRWLFLAGTSLALPLHGVKRIDEDLSSTSQLVAEFGECLETAWRSVDKTSSVPAGMAPGLAEFALRQGDPALARRKTLANLVATIVANAPEG